jgi:hypothetical protein
MRDETTRRIFEKWVMDWLFSEWKSDGSSTPPPVPMARAVRMGERPRNARGPRGLAARFASRPPSRTERANTNSAEKQGSAHRE